jgi:hypothetical protein
MLVGLFNVCSVLQQKTKHKLNVINTMTKQYSI